MKQAFIFFVTILLIAKVWGQETVTVVLKKNQEKLKEDEVAITTAQKKMYDLVAANASVDQIQVAKETLIKAIDQKNADLKEDVLQRNQGNQEQIDQKKEVIEDRINDRRED